MLEQAVGEAGAGRGAPGRAGMIRERRILPLQGDVMTTLAVRAREQAIERRFVTARRARWP